MRDEAEIFASLRLPPEIESELRLVGGEQGLALRYDPAIECVDLVRLPPELRGDPKPNEVPRNVLPREALVPGLQLTTGDDVLVVADVLGLVVLVVRDIGDQDSAFVSWIGAW